VAVRHQPIDLRSEAIVKLAGYRPANDGRAHQHLAVLETADTEAMAGDRLVVAMQFPYEFIRLSKG
jgi:hypothetical protein